MHYPTLRTAAQSGDLNATKDFLDKGYNPSQKLSSGTLLQHVIRDNLTDIAILLIERGAEINTQDKFGLTPLHEAATNGNKILVEQLLIRGANPFICDIKARTAGMLAERNGHKALACRLHSDFISKYPNLSFISSNLAQKSETQTEPLDLSKKGPCTNNASTTFFKLYNPSQLPYDEKLTIEIDPSYVFFKPMNC